MKAASGTACGPWRAGRPARAAAAVAAALLALASAPAPAAERPFPTIVALGYDQPLETTQGLPSPIVVLDHRSGGAPEAPAWRVSLRTSVLAVRRAWPLGERAQAGLLLRAQGITEGDGQDLYRDGERLGPTTFAGDSLAGGVLLRLALGGGWIAGLEADRQQAVIYRTGDTAPGLRLPPDFRQNELRLGIERLAEGPALGLALEAGHRERWRDWALDPVPKRAREHADYARVMLRWEQAVAWSAGQESRMEAQALDGQALDLFSGYRIGGFAGQHPVAGYFRNEYRASRALVAHLTHELTWGQSRALTFGLDAARLRELALPYLPGRPALRTLLGAWLGLRYPLAPLGGAPLILRYGEGLAVPAASREGKRREVVLALAAGF